MNEYTANTEEVLAAEYMDIGGYPAIIATYVTPNPVVGDYFTAKGYQTSGSSGTIHGAGGNSANAYTCNLLVAEMVSW